MRMVVCDDRMFQLRGLESCLLCAPLLCLSAHSLSGSSQYRGGPQSRELRETKQTCN